MNARKYYIASHWWSLEHSGVSFHKTGVCITAKSTSYPFTEGCVNIQTYTSKASQFFVGTPTVW